MKISWIKYKEDEESFRMFKNLGLNVLEMEDLEKTDQVIDELIQKDYHTIILSNEVASFSEDILKKYNKTKEVNIIIAPSKEQKLD